MSLQCPKCGSTEVAGLMGAFWVKLDQREDPIGQWSDWANNTELMPDRECTKCNHQWGGEEDGNPVVDGPDFATCPKGHRFRTVESHPAKSEREWECPNCAVAERNKYCAIVEEICKIFTDSTPENIVVVLRTYIRTIEGVKRRRG